MLDTNIVRKKILELAMQGKLSKREKGDSSSRELYDSILAHKKELIKAGTIRKDIKLDDPVEEFEIPDNWTLARFGKIITLQSGQDLTAAEYNSSGFGIPYMTGASNFDDDGSMIVNRWTEHAKAFAQRGDILISCKGTVGKLAILEEDKVHIARQIMGIKTYFINIDFAKYFVESGIDRIKDASKGLIPGIERKDILNLCCPLPPIEEQERIAKKVNELFDLLDCIDDYQKSYFQDVEILKNKILDAGIQGKLTQQLPSDGCAEELFETIQNQKKYLIKEKTIKKEKALSEISDEEIPFELPQGWKWVRLGDICSKISSGNTPAGGAKGGAYVDKGYCFFREQNIYNDGIHEEGMVYISEELLDSRPNSTVLPNDILLNITGGSIGRCALVPEDFTRGSINQHILIIRTVDPRIRFYVHKCLCSPYYQKLIMGNVVGDKDGFSAGRCKNTLIPLPPINEQERIVERIDSLLSAIG